MEKKKLLIADSTEEFRLALADILQETYQIRICKTGPDALALLHSFQPHVALLDLMLPGLDGISLLQSISSSDHHPMILATTRFFSEFMMESLGLFQPDYMMVKPCDIQATVARIHELSQRTHAAPTSPVDPKTRAASLLLSLKVPSKLDGFDYLREAIPSIAQHPGQSITKELYPSIASLFGTNKVNVERSIRNAIEKAWACREEPEWLRYFSPNEDGVFCRPTNAAFICRLASALELPREE